MPRYIPLTSTEQVDAVLRDSGEQPVAFFKHSTTCSISSLAKARLDRALVDEDVDVYVLDLLRFRSVSSYLAELSGVRHESPQLLVFKGGQVVYDGSHLDIEPHYVLN